MRRKRTKTDQTLPKRGGTKTRLIMEKKQTITMLQYRIRRYKAMGNGAMCQTLTNELYRLQNPQPKGAN